MKKSSFLWIILISLAISPAIALGEGNRNLFLIGVMLLSPLIVISNQRFAKSDILLLLFMLSIVLIPLINQPESLRWSTIIYTMMFGFTFIAYKQLLHKEVFNIEDYKNLLMYLIYAYFFVLLVQQFCVAVGLPIFNISNYDTSEPWKLNSLAAEPSHSARIVALLMYCYIYIKELIEQRPYNFRIDFKNDKWIWLAFLWTMLTMGSGTAFLFIALILLKFVKFKNVVALFFIFGIVIAIVNILSITSFERTFKVIMAVLTLDEKMILIADHSAAVRILPMIILAKMVNFTTLNGWFGYGIDFVSSFMSYQVPGVPKGFSGGAMFQFWIEYGFVPFFLFIIFSIYNSIAKSDYLTIILWVMLVFLSSINSQMLWLTLVLLLTNKYFYKKIKEREAS